MVYYNGKLKCNSRLLRYNMTDAEKLIWSRIRCKQICKTQFYRQRPISSFIVDFYAPIAKLVLEIDGAQHLEEIHLRQDKYRDEYLNGLGILVLRFYNNQVMSQLNSVLEAIYIAIQNFKKHRCHRLEDLG